VGITPARYLDTRGGSDTTFDGAFSGGGVVYGTTKTVQIAGRGNVAAGAKAAFINLTVVNNSTLPGFVTVYPCDAPRPTASTLNVGAYGVVANGAMVKLAADGTLCLFSSTLNYLVVDVTGYVPAGSDSISPLVPSRLFDSRAGEPIVDGVGAGPRLAAGSTVEVQVTGRVNIPVTATAAFLNVVVVSPDGPGFATLYPCGTLPGTSSVNYTTGTIVANNATTMLSPTGSVCIYVMRGTDVVLDVTGYIE
ncbi:MAG TPA: hypothetical protein PLV68_07285, partial [Ilumatobacteraceae bacterium]|nr:hypothetical protein [Ilumatobacteraceae bacterium]